MSRNTYKVLFPTILSFAFLLSLSPASAKDSATGQFNSVTGAVTVTEPGEATGRPARTGATVVEGARITSADGATAVLSFFDGSRLTVQPSTDFTLSRLQKPSTRDKILKFKLALGSLLAEVKKLATSKSSFEIEAGGVVCGVRGTKFSMDYDPTQAKVDLKVSEGSVFAESGGTRRVVNAGEELRFLKGVPSKAQDSQGPGSKEKLSEEPSGMDDPSLRLLHYQFAGGVRAYEDESLNDPNAAGLKYRLNGPVSFFIPASKTWLVQPGGTSGIIQANP